MWGIAPSQLDTDAGQVYDTTFYGKNGLETGTLCRTTDLTASALRYRADICANFENLELAAGETSLANVFEGYAGTSLPLFDMSNITNLSYAFYNCINLKTLPNLRPGNCTTLYYAFYHCEFLEELPAIDATNITNLSHAFHGCYMLKEINISNTSTVPLYEQIETQIKNQILNLILTSYKIL